MNRRGLQTPILRDVNSEDDPRRVSVSDAVRSPEEIAVLETVSEKKWACAFAIDPMIMLVLSPSLAEMRPTDARSMHTLRTLFSERGTTRVTPRFMDVDQRTLPPNIAALQQTVTLLVEWMRDTPARVYQYRMALYMHGCASRRGVPLPHCLQPLLEVTVDRSPRDLARVFYATFMANEAVAVSMSHGTLQGMFALLCKSLHHVLSDIHFQSNAMDVDKHIRKSRRANAPPCETYVSFCKLYDLLFIYVNSVLRTHEAFVYEVRRASIVNKRARVAAPHVHVPDAVDAAIDTGVYGPSDLLAIFIAWCARGYPTIELPIPESASINAAVQELLRLMILRERRDPFAVAREVGGNVRNDRILVKRLGSGGADEDDE